MFRQRPQPGSLQPWHSSRDRRWPLPTS